MLNLKELKRRYFSTESVLYNSLGIELKLIRNNTVVCVRVCTVHLKALAFVRNKNKT